MKQVYRVPSHKFKHSQSSACSLDILSLQKKKRKEKEKWRKNEKGRVTERCKVYTGDQVRNHFRHAFSVRGFKLNSKIFPGKEYTLFSAKASGFREFRLKGLGL